MFLLPRNEPILRLPGRAWFLLTQKPLPPYVLREIDGRPAGHGACEATTTPGLVGEL